MLRRELGDDYIDNLFGLWAERVPQESDLCCYWFEKARSEIEYGRAQRQGFWLLRGSEEVVIAAVLDRIAQTGAIFWAQSDRKWALDGATVQVSMVGFDDGCDTTRELDGLQVSEIHTTSVPVRLT